MTDPITDIPENQLHEAIMDSVEWGKEIDRVGPILLELNRELEKAQGPSQFKMRCKSISFSSGQY